jgi:hypothetical protein
MGELKLPLLLHDNHGNDMELLCLYVSNLRKKKKGELKFPLFLATTSTSMARSFALSFACLKN